MFNMLKITLLCGDTEVWKKNYAFAPRMRDRSQTGAAAEVTLLIFGSMHVQQSNQSLFTIARPHVNRGC